MPILKFNLKGWDMTQKKDNSLVKEFQKVLLDEKNFLKNLFIVYVFVFC